MERVIMTKSDTYQT